ncbi:MAG: BamA/TamA family outer membrane protein [Spirochaetia bacterium]|nr:BamA/TamA family outer membrane protein [Spirochaetia bacterium]
MTEFIKFRALGFFLFFIAFFLTSLTAFSLGRKVVWEDLDWKVIHSEHFDIHYPEGFDLLGKTAMLYAEEANIVLSQKFKHNLSQVIPVFIYPSHNHFQTTNIIYDNIQEGVGGFTERLKKRVVVPFMGSYDDFRHVITHELVHAFQYDILLGGGLGGVFASQYALNPPLWLVEGMAEYFSIGWDETADMTIRDAILTNTMPTIVNMTEFQVFSGYMLYKGGQSVMLFIAETYGEEKIADFFKDIRDIRNLNDAIKTNFGITLEVFEKKWMLFLKRKFYPQINKNYDEEEAVLLSKHFLDKSFFNMHPSISTDGKYVAYISIRDFLPAIVLRKIGSGKENKDYSLSKNKSDESEIILVHAGISSDFYQIHLLDNRLSFTPDSKSIFFCAQSLGKDRLYLFDIHNQKITRTFTPALDMIQRPKLSYDGKSAVFTGAAAGKTDLYLLNIETSKIKQLTNDLFSEQEGAISPDNKTVVFSSNKNSDNNFESNEYHLFELDIESLKIKQLTFEKGRQISPSFAADNNNKILFSSNQTGIYNAYLYDKKNAASAQITDVTGGVFDAQTDGNAEKISFVMYRNQGYDIAYKKFPREKDYIKPSKNEFNFKDINYPAYPAGLSSIRPDIYNSRFSLDWLFFGFQFSSTHGYGGYSLLGISDYLGNHQLMGYFDYLSGRENSMNFKFDYGYLKNRTNFYVGGFKTSDYYNIFNLFNLASINDFLYSPSYYTLKVNRFGGYAALEYPFSPFFSIDSRLEISHYEEFFQRGTAYEKLDENYKRPDIQTNIQSVSLGSTYNNVLYSYEGPLKGVHFRYNVEQSFKFSGNDFIFNRQTLDLRYYYSFLTRYVFAFRFFLGNISGPQKDYFPWQIGGYNTLRAYPFLSMKGTNIFFSNIELRFPFIDAIVLGFPVQWIMQGFSMVIFMDIGSAFNNYKKWDGYNESEKRLEDLKISFGLGARMILFPGFLLKIDWGTPWDLKKALPISKWEGRFSMGYQY